MAEQSSTKQKPKSSKTTALFKNISLSMVALFYSTHANAVLLEGMGEKFQEFMKGLFAEAIIFVVIGVLIAIFSPRFRSAAIWTLFLVVLIGGGLWNAGEIVDVLTPGGA